MDSDELQVMASFMINAYGGQAFLAAVKRAKAMSADGYLETAGVWERIAERISEMETSTALDRAKVAAGGSNPE